MTEYITTNLSRLALAKAIKTPDTNDEEVEPWDHSVIFHQPHISAQMRDSLQDLPKLVYSTFPASHKSDSRRPRSRLDSQLAGKRQSAFQLQECSNLGPSSNPGTQRFHKRSVSTPLMMSSDPLKETKSKPTKKHMPSDDEDEDQESEESDEDDEDDEDSVRDKNEGSAVNNDTSYTDILSSSDMIQTNDTFVNAQTSITTPATVNSKPTKVLPLPSDDEDEEDSDDEERSNDNNSDDEDDATSSQNKIGNRKSEHIENQKDAFVANDAHTQARRESTLRQLEQGPSLSKSYSLGDTLNATLPVAPSQEARQQTPFVTRDSRFLNYHARPDDKSTDRGSSGMYAAPETAPLRPLPRSTMSEMDIMQYSTQLQLQQFQFQQFQQLQQLQQFQLQQSAFARAAQQQQMMQHRSFLGPMSSKHASAMDLLIQIEQQKEQKAAALRKPKKLDSSNAPIHGLLANVPAQGMHNVSFQQAQDAIKNNADRKRGPAYRTSRYEFPTIVPSSSSHRMSTMTPKKQHSSSYLPTQRNTDTRRRTQMLQSGNMPQCVSSMSTPIPNAQGMYSINVDIPSSTLDLPMINTSQSSSKATNRNNV